MLKLESYIPWVCLVVMIGMMALIVDIATDRKLTTFESVILQVFSLSAGLLGSYLLGKRTSKELIQKAVRPHARSAFRRLISLYRSISRVATTIEDSKPENERYKIAVIKAIVIEQLNTADDALEDWQDLDPDSVTELRKKLKDDTGK